MKPVNPKHFKPRTIAIGDIHGHLQALTALLSLIEPVPADTLVFLGDYIDRGPDSKGVLQFLIDLKARCHVVCIMGNHEDMMLDACKDPAKLDLWKKNGGAEALQSYGNANDFRHVPQSHIDFLSSLPLYHEMEKHFFIHANYASNWKLEETNSGTALWRSLEDRPGRHYSGKTAILGHTPQMNGEFLNLDYLICIDTGCGFGGRLSALEVFTGRCWQVNEQGQETP